MGFSGGFGKSQASIQSVSNLGLSFNTDVQRGNALIMAMSTQNSEIMGTLIRSQDKANPMFELGDYNRLQLGAQGERILKAAGYDFDVIKAVKDTLPKAFALFTIGAENDTSPQKIWEGKIGVGAMTSDAKQDWWKREYGTDLIQTQLNTPDSVKEGFHAAGSTGIGQYDKMYGMSADGSQIAQNLGYSIIGNGTKNADGKIGLSEVNKLTVNMTDRTTSTHEILNTNGQVGGEYSVNHDTIISRDLSQIYNDIITKGPGDIAFGKEGLKEGYSTNGTVYKRVFDQTMEKLGYTDKFGENLYNQNKSGNTLGYAENTSIKGDTSKNWSDLTQAEKDAFIWQNGPNSSKQNLDRFNNTMINLAPLDTFDITTATKYGETRYSAGDVRLSHWNQFGGEGDNVVRIAKGPLGADLSRAYLIPGYALFDKDSYYQGFDPSGMGAPPSAWDKFAQEKGIKNTYEGGNRQQWVDFGDWWSKQKDNPDNTFGGMLVQSNADLKAQSENSPGIKFERSSVNAFTGAEKKQEYKQGDMLFQNPFSGATISTGTEQANKYLGIDPNAKKDK